MGSWLPWSVGIGLVALATGLLAAARWRRARNRAAGREPRPTRRGRPQAGEIWWADVPYEDGTGSKVRPCLVLRVRRRSADVLKITSQEKGNRRDHVRLPTKRWDPRAGRDSFLDVVSPIRVPTAAFVRHAGPCDAAVWRGVRQLHGVRGGDPGTRAGRPARSHR